ncbi:VOC family protein [Parvibium lacunae]|uniref:VOC family protein n=1 Tax=Parvibium lacunae TaxID=1888893 RepID=A0A368L0L6_9BURK|nr:VOC family protein [Parvibium lacunae]RCS57089.1 VOC family protein [Parvibium lacunae]
MNQTPLPPILGLHHAAYRCRDAEETRAFYEDLLGLPLFHYIEADHVPSTGEYCPYVHIFFRLADGSCIAFFDLGDNQAAAPSPNTPAWVNHIAFAVPDLAALETIRQRLLAQGVAVLGPTDHHIFQSIYFFDPNGIRLELTAQLASPAQMQEKSTQARHKLAAWTQRKAARQTTAG